jgi:alkyl hydroperoxide reductase subunit AhpC
MDRFERYSALPLAISIDSEEVHQSYLQHKWEKSRELLPFPLCKYFGLACGLTCGERR